MLRRQRLRRAEWLSARIILSIQGGFAPHWAVGRPRYNESAISFGAGRWTLEKAATYLGDIKDITSRLRTRKGPSLDQIAPVVPHNTVGAVSIPSRGDVVLIPFVREAKRRRLAMPINDTCLPLIVCIGPSDHELAGPNRCNP